MRPDSAPGFRWDSPGFRRSIRLSGAAPVPFLTPPLAPRKTSGQTFFGSPNQDAGG